MSNTLEVARKLMLESEISQVWVSKIENETLELRLQLLTWMDEECLFFTGYSLKNDAPVWSRDFIVHFGQVQVIVSANCEDSAVDEAVDACEKLGWEGIFEDEPAGDEDPPDTMRAGNHGRLIPTADLHIEELIT